MQNHVTIELLRHGETTAGPCFLGSTDAPLSEQGWQQMQSAISNENYQRIISSPLKRCVEFARQLAQESCLPLMIEDDLREINFGDWEAKTTEQLWKSQQNQLKAFWDDPINNTPPGAENFTDFQSRVNSVFQKISCQYQEERILLVSHGGVIRQIISCILSIPFKKAQKINIDHAGISRVDCYDGNMNIRFINLRLPG